MIVEDEEPLIPLLRYNLEAEGYEVDAVARGDDADTRLKETAPDLVVLDWMLTAGTRTFTSRSRTSTPRPWHVGHGVGMTWPRPPHVGHTCENENGPWSTAIDPEPWHCGHVSGEVPGAAPLP